MCQVKTNTNTNNCYHPPSLLRQQQTQSGKEDINAKYKYEYIVAPACFVGLKTTAKRTKEEDLSTNTFFNDLGQLYVQQKLFKAAYQVIIDVATLSKLS